MFKSKILSTIFGKADESDDKLSIVKADEQILKLENENTRLRGEITLLKLQQPATGNAQEKNFKSSWDAEVSKYLH